MPRGEAKKSRIVREDLNVEISRKLISLGIGWKENQQVFSDVAIVIFKKNECDSSQWESTVFFLFWLGVTSVFFSFKLVIWSTMDQLYGLCWNEVSCVEMKAHSPSVPSVARVFSCFMPHSSATRLSNGWWPKSTCHLNL